MSTECEWDTDTLSLEVETTTDLRSTSVEDRNLRVSLRESGHTFTIASGHQGW